MTVTRPPACTVKGCPAPRDPDWHVPICGHGLEGHHHHVVKRSQGGKGGLQVFICPDCHRNIDEGEWGNAVKPFPGRGSVYFAWDLHGNTLIEKEVMPGEPEQRVRSQLDQREVGRDGQVLSDGGEARGRERQPRPVVGLNYAGSSPPSLSTKEESALDDWCRRGMGFVYNGERLEVLTDEWRWQVGEWLNEGEGMMPEEVHGYLRGFRSPMALRQYAWVAAVVTRVTGLSWTHHRAVAALPAPERQEKLEEALVKGLSTRSMMGPGEPRERHNCPDCGAEHQVKA